MCTALSVCKLLARQGGGGYKWGLASLFQRIFGNKEHTLKGLYWTLRNSTQCLRIGLIACARCWEAGAVDVPQLYQALSYHEDGCAYLAYKSLDLPEGPQAGKIFFKWFKIKVKESLSSNLDWINSNYLSKKRKIQNLTKVEALGFDNTYLIVDCSDYSISRPVNSQIRRSTYSGKDKQFQIKYLLAVLASTGDIVYCSKAYPGNFLFF